MGSEQVNSRQARRSATSVEWPTIAVAVGCWASWVTLLALHQRIPTPMLLIAFGVSSAWYLSLQHEVIHGHPTPWRWVNLALAFTPLSLWLPFRIYSESHLEHHEVELTIPGVDPESFYVTGDEWAGMGRLRRRLLTINRTFVGRLAIGPALGPPALVWSEWRKALHDRSLAVMWLVHALFVGAVCWLVFGVAQVPVWQYLLGYCYAGMSVTYIRSFVEHRAVDAPETRSAVVRSGRVFGLLFLNNNLHHTHHAMPGVAWYRLPEMTRRIGATEIAARGAGAYRGYLEIIRRFAFRAISDPVNPLVTPGAAAGERSLTT